MSASRPGPDPPSRWLVSGEDAGARLDSYIAQRLQTPRNRVQVWIRDGCVVVAARSARRPSIKVQSGQEVVVTPPGPLHADETLDGEPGDLHILHQDEDLIFIDKPAGLVVHPGAGNEHGTLCQHLLWHFPEIVGIGHPRRPGIVHRLDAGTTGVMVIARSQRAYDALSSDFAERRVAKRYLAIVHGVPKDTSGEIDLPIGRHRQDRKRMAVAPGGRPAQTRYRVLQSGPRVSALGIRLLTGRTHQIRVHLKERRHPLIGDPVYGEERWKELAGRAKGFARSFDRPALHAWRLTIAHPISGQEVDVQSRPPEDLGTLWQGLTNASLEHDPPSDL